MEWKDSVKDQTTTTGTGAITLTSPAISGYRTVAAAHTDGATVNFRIYNSNQTEWEVSRGVFTLGTLNLTRETVYASSNGGSLVNFSAGTKTIVTGCVAQDFAGGVINRVGTAASSATPSINTDLYDVYKLTALAVDITSFTTNLSGTPYDTQLLQIIITGTAARAITWGASFVSSTITLPTTTVSTDTIRVTLQYDSVIAKWVCVGVA